MMWWVPRRAGAPMGSLAGPGRRKRRGRVGLKAVFLAPFAQADSRVLHGLGM